MRTSDLIPGWIPTSLIAGLLWFAIQYLQVEFPGADWLPLALALIGYVAKTLVVKPAPPATSSVEMSRDGDDFGALEVAVEYDRPLWAKLLLW